MSARPTGHDVPTGVEGGEPADGPPAPEPTHAERCRTLVEAVGRGTLCTVAVRPAGYPYGSVASYALDGAGNPLVFVSLMAEHTQNALADPRASFLVAEPVPEGADPLASGPVTQMGDLARVGDDEVAEVRDRYLAANPSAGYYIDFGDFVFLRLAVRDIRYVGGYGRMSWVDADGYARAEPDPLAGGPAARIIEHMNADHAEAQVLLCRHLAGRPDTTEASMSAVDRYGFELVAVGPTGRAAVRLGFPEPCDDADAVRRAVVAMVGRARRAADAG